jgi:regulator of protease activity HflC (stomatin/prohibitin superfamily)
MASEMEIQIATIKKTVIGVVAFLIISFAGCKSFVTVPTGTRAVVSHFGKVQEKVLDEGIHWITPFVADITLMSVKLKLDVIKTSAASKDLQEISGDIAVNWNFDPNDVNGIYQGIGTVDTVVQAVIVPATNEIFKSITARYSAEQVLTSRAELKQKLDDELKVRLAKYKVVLIDASIQHIEFSKEFNEAIEQKQIAEQAALQAKYVAQQAEQEAQATVNRAKGQAESILLAARAKADGQKLLQISLTPMLIQQQAIEKWDGHYPQFVAGSNAIPLININPKSYAKSE